MNPEQEPSLIFPFFGTDTWNHVGYTESERVTENRLTFERGLRTLEREASKKRKRGWRK